MTQRVESLVTFKKFTGLNIEDEPSLLADTEASELINFLIGSAGNLVKRPGLVKVGSFQFPATPMRILGQFLTASFNSIIASTPTNVYKSDDNGLTWTSIGTVANAIAGAQYLDKFYMVTQANGVQKWDGATFAAVASSPSGTHILSFKDRIWVVGSASTLYYSDPGAGSETYGASSFIKIGAGDGDKLVVVINFADRLICFKSRAVYNLYLSGDPTTWVLRPASMAYGCTSPYGVMEIEGLLYFISLQGVYRTDGNLFREVSSKIRSAFRGRPLLASTFSDDDTISYIDRRVICTFAASVGFKTYIYHIDNNGWTEARFASGANTIPGKILPCTASNGQRRYLASARSGSGFLFEISQSGVYTDNGLTYDASYRGKRFDMDQYPRMKRGKIMVCEFNGTSAKPVIGYFVDGSPDFFQVVGLSDLIVDRSAAYRVAGPGMFREVEVYLKDSTNQFFNIMSLSLIVMGSRTIVDTV